MVSKKQVLGEVQKFNKDLEKYVSYIDSDLLVDKTLSSSNSANSEYLALVSSTLLDVRKELILMRKNLSLDVESMVKSSLKEFEESMAKKILSSQSNLFLENKRMFLEYQEQMEDTVRSIQKELSFYKTSFTSLSSELEDLKKENEHLKTLNQEIISSFKIEIHKLSNELSSLPRYDDLVNLMKQMSSSYSTSLLRELKTNLKQFIGDLPRPIEQTTRSQIPFKRQKDLFLENELPEFSEKQNSVNNGSKILEIDSRIRKLDEIRS